MGPKSHETDNLRPLLLSCNLTKSVYVNNTIMKTLPYKNKETLIECNPIQFYCLRSHLIDICDPPQEFHAKGERTLTTRLHDTLSVP